MATKRAKTLDDLQFAKLLYAVSQGPDGLRDQAMLMLSYKAGLRAQEIAGLEWADVSDAEGAVRNDFIFIPSDIAKNGRERSVPMNPHLHTALLILRSQNPDARWVIYGQGKGVYQGNHNKVAKRTPRMTPSAVAMWFHRLYEKHDFEGCSSHSGRRTFITRLARKAGAHECSIRDVQMLAGHASLSTTERYVDVSPHVSRLVAAI